MQVQSVGQNVGFKGRRDNVDAAINLDDRTIQQASYVKALSSTNDNKHRKISKAMFLSIPLAAGLASLVLTRGKASYFNKIVSGPSAKLANGLKSAGFWTAGIAAVSAASYGRRKLNENSECARSFNEKHPVLSFVATAATALGVLIAAPKAYDKVVKMISPANKFKMGKTLVNTAEKINNNKFIKGAMNNFSKLENKMPSALKGLGAILLSWAPEMFLIGGVVHSSRHDSKVKNSYINNYNEMKHRQLDLSKARLKEISKSNVALKNENESLAVQNGILSQELDARISKPQHVVEETPKASAEITKEVQAKIDEKIEAKVAEKIEEAITEAAEAIQEAQQAQA